MSRRGDNQNLGTFNGNVSDVDKWFLHWLIDYLLLSRTALESVDKGSKMHDACVKEVKNSKIVASGAYCDPFFI